MTSLFTINKILVLMIIYTVNPQINPEKAVFESISQEQERNCKMLQQYKMDQLLSRMKNDIKEPYEIVVCKPLAI